MIKVFSLLRRREDWTRAQFQRWWLQEHVPEVVGLPGLRRYRVSLTTGSTTHADADIPFDGVAELWFDDRAALDRAWTESEAGRTAVAHSQANTSMRWTLITEEHEFVG